MRSTLIFLTIAPYADPVAVMHRTNVSLLSNRVSAVAVMAWSAALLDSNPYGTDGPGWAWTSAALVLCGGSILAYLVLQVSQSQKNESKRVVLDKMSHLVASNFGWSACNQHCPFTSSKIPKP